MFQIYLYFYDKTYFFADEFWFRIANIDEFTGYVCRIYTNLLVTDNESLRIYETVFARLLAIFIEIFANIFFGSLIANAALGIAA